MSEVRVLARWRVAVAVVAFVAAALGAGVRATDGGHASVDEPQYLLSALSLWEDRDLDIADELADERWRAFHDRALPVQTQVLDGGRQVSPHDPLLPLVLAVPYGLGGWVAAKLVLAALSAALAALLLTTAVRRLQVPLGAAVPGVALAAASAPWAVYGQQVYPELPAALAVAVAAHVLLDRWPLRRPSVVLLVSAVVALPWLSVKYAVVAAVLAVLGLDRVRREQGWGPVMGPVSALAAAGVVYLALHRVVWGGWTVYASGDHFQQTGELSVVGVTPDYWGRSIRLVGLLVDRDYGLAAWAPAALLVVPALAAVLRARPRGWEVLVLPAAAGWLVATFVALTMHGYWWPGRQVVVVLPLLVLLVLVAVSRWGPRVRALAALLGAAGPVVLGALLLAGWTGTFTWVDGFASLADPVTTGWRTLLPDHRDRTALDWALHAAWLLVLAAAALAGGRSAGAPVQRPAPAQPAPDPTPDPTPMERTP